MKKTNIIYWTSTILFAGLMLFSAVPDVISSPDAVAFMTNLGYPLYFVPFIGVMKVLGCLAILIPGYPRIKEWAYAGLFFDLTGAFYSLIAKFGFNIQMTFLLLWVISGIVSYIYYHKKINTEKINN